jgi:urea transport system permease protein
MLDLKLESPAATPPATDSQLSYLRSQTFLAKQPDADVYRLRLGVVVGLLSLFFIVIPVLNAANVVPDYKLNFLGKYLSLSLVAIGIDLIWGYTGILSLCQGFFFCLGAYAMSMHLSLPEGGGVYRIPQFMEFAYYGHGGQLPPFWKPFRSLAFAISAGIVLPALVAGLFGFFIFRSRVRGVYFSIITQAVAWGAWLLISRNEMLLGGTNGLTNFYRPLTQSRHWIVMLYFTTLVMIVLAYLLCRAIAQSKLGRVLVAIRDKETRLYFAGYRPYAFKVFAFVLAAILAGIGGMLYAPQTGIVTPQNMNVEASILMVIWVALGGRGRLWGAIFGTLVVNYTYTAMTSDMPTIWPFIQGGMFLAVVLAFPDGMVGLWDQLEKQVKLGDWLGATGIAVSFIAIALFVLAQSLGVMPPLMEKVAVRNASVGDIKIKYLTLIGLIVLSAVSTYLRKRSYQIRSVGALPGVQPA